MTVDVTATRKNGRSTVAALAAAALIAALPAATASATPSEPVPPSLANYAVANTALPGVLLFDTVLTIEPLDYNAIRATPRVLQGVLCKAPHDCIEVPTPAALDLNHQRNPNSTVGPIPEGAARLDLQLHDIGGGHKTVLAYSQGSQIAGYWLRHYSQQSSSIPVHEDTNFVLLGDPENTYGFKGSSTRIMANPGFDVTELWIQYDGWADWPTRFNPLAIANAVYGMFVVHATRYNKVDFEDPSIVTWAADGITYKMVPSPMLPILEPLANIGLRTLAETLNAKLKPIVEAAYDRPATQEAADAYMAADSIPTPAKAASTAPASTISMEALHSATDPAPMAPVLNIDKPKTGIEIAPVSEPDEPPVHSTVSDPVAADNAPQDMSSTDAPQASTVDAATPQHRAGTRGPSRTGASRGRPGR